MARATSLPARQRRAAHGAGLRRVHPGDDGRPDGGAAALADQVAFITYGYVVHEAGRLSGLITMRDLLFAPDDARLEDLMLRDVFTLRPELPLPGRDEVGARAPLPGLPGVRRERRADRPRARAGDVRGAGDRDHRAGRLDGGRREGGAARDAAGPQLQVPPSLAAVQPHHRLRRGSGGGHLPGHRGSPGDTGGVPAGAGGPVRQYRLPGAGGDACAA